jgi:hypothetical protein
MATATMPVDSVHVRNMHVNTISLLTATNVMASSIQSTSIQSSSIVSTQTFSGIDVACSDITINNTATVDGAFSCATCSATHYIGLPDASIASKGIVRLDDSTSSSSTTTVATINRWVFSYGRLYYEGGPVGLGTRTPACQLHVNGDLRVDNGKVTINGDLYVTGNIYQI